MESRLLAVVERESVLYAGATGWVKPGDLTPTSLEGTDSREARMIHLSKLVQGRMPVVIACAGFLALPAQALGAEASEGAYGGSGPGPAADGLRQGSAQEQAVSGNTGGSAASRGQAPAAGPAAEASSSSSSKLPFTALDMALLLGAGGVFTGAGLVMRRMSIRSKLA